MEKKKIRKEGIDMKRNMMIMLNGVCLV